ncbi:hypothetical protein BpHYR1_018044, partial [Brachionus plicatilis]
RLLSKFLFYYSDSITSVIYCIYIIVEFLFRLEFYLRQFTICLTILTLYFNNNYYTISLYIKSIAFNN